MLCPVCRANNDAGPGCRRCKADLSVLFDIEARRGELLATARARLGDPTACAAAAAADGLRRGADARRLLAIACLLRGDPAGAWGAYLQATRT